MIESSEQIGTISWKTETPKSLQFLTINDRNDFQLSSGSKTKKLDKNVPLYSLLAVYRMYLPLAELSPLYSRYLVRLVRANFFFRHKYFPHTSYSPR